MIPPIYSPNARQQSAESELNIGAWEFIVHKLATIAKINTSEARIKRFTGNYDIFLTKRFDREDGKRIHFASAMTLLNRKDGGNAEDGVSYCEHLARKFVSSKEIFRMKRAFREADTKR